MGPPEAGPERIRRLADARALSLIGRGQRVLHLGCGRGGLSAALHGRGCRVVGVAADEDAAGRAADHCDDVVVGDLDRLDLDAELGDRRFDAVLAVDVLQRARDPEALLARLGPFLAPGGYVVASVPNVAHASVRLAVLGGSFPYADTGPLDRTAVRFFTRASLEAALSAGGFRVAHVESVDLDVDGAKAPPSLGEPLRALVKTLADRPDARAYELIAVAFPDRPSDASAPKLAPLPDSAGDDHAAAGDPVGFPAPAEEIFDERQLLYLDLLKRMLTRDGFPQRKAPARLPVEGVDPELRTAIAAFLDGCELDVVHRVPPTEWPVDAETMLTRPRLDSLVSCVGTVVRDGVPGDLIETGVWRGGACILMRAVLQALGDRSRTVWVADSFQGLPKPDPERYPADEGDLFWTVDLLAVSLREVMDNFERYGLLDDRVRFLPGWFADTLPSAPIERLAVLRLDGDMYASTMQALDALYPKLSVGGFAIIDDYGAVPGCAAAVADYREAHGITEPLGRTDYTEVLWRKER